MYLDVIRWFGVLIRITVILLIIGELQHLSTSVKCQTVDTSTIMQMKVQSHS
jgi:hypothetical protein